MLSLDGKQRRRILRRELLRRCRVSLAGVAALAAIGLFFFGRGLGPATLMDSYRTGWLMALVAALCLALIRGKNSLRLLLRRMPVRADDEIRVRLEIGLACGVLILIAFTCVEIWFRPHLLRPTLKSHLNAAERATFENLPGIPLIRYTLDGQDSSELVTEDKLGDLRRFGTPTPYEVPSEPPPPGATLIQVSRTDWATLEADDTRRMRWLTSLEFTEGTEVQVVLERYVAEYEYLSQSWHRDAFSRHRVWPLLDRSICFLFSLAMLIAFTTAREPWKKLMTCPDYSDLHALTLLTVALFFLSFNSISNLLLPAHQAMATPWRQLVWPGAMTVVGLFTLQWGIRHLRFIYGELPPNQVRTRLNKFLFSIILPTVYLTFVGVWLADWIFSAPSGEASHSSGGGHDASALADMISLSLIFAWVVVLVVATAAPVNLARSWARRDPLISRLPTQPRFEAWRRMKKLLARQALFFLIPVAVNLTVAGLWAATSGFHNGRVTAIDFSLLLPAAQIPFLMIWGMAIFGGGLIALVLTLHRRASIQAAILVGLGFVAIFLYTTEPLFGLLVIAAIVPGYLWAFHTMQRNITMGYP